MFRTAKSIKSLRQYYKDKLAELNIEQFSAEVTGHSDRAFVILLTSILEDVLTFRIARHLSFVPDEAQFDYIFRFEGPLGTFSARTEIAYLFGFIDECTRSQISDMREMRNACAHSKRPIDFDVPELASVAKRLFHPNGVVVLSGETRSDIRRAFFTEFLFLYHILMEGSRDKGEAIVRAALAKHGVHFPSPGKPPQQ